MPKYPFTKMQGLGNDFVVLNGTKDHTLPDLQRFARKQSDRRFGIGFDQLLVVKDSESADYKMEIFNADGGQVEMCGNGIRCVAKYLLEHNITEKSQLTIETLAGMIRTEVLDYVVQVDMGEPILEAAEIPTTKKGMLVNHPLEIQGEKCPVTCVSMGNPHCIIFVKDLEKFPVDKLGPLLEKHELFPNRTNVEFVQINNPMYLKMRVWERGAGETLACGTGACATLVAAVLNGHSQRKATVALKGGELEIVWSERDNHIYMTGPAEESFLGEIEVH